MNEIESIRWHLGRYRAVPAQQIDRLYNPLEELQRTSFLFLRLDGAPDDKIDHWLQEERFAADEGGCRLDLDQDIGNIALQYPYIDQHPAITSDFD